MCSIGLSEQLFHNWNERSALWQIKTRKCDGSSGTATSHGTAVIRFRGRNLLGLEQGTPELVGLFGFGDACGCQEGVDPVGSSISVLEGPVALCEVSFMSERGERKTYVPGLSAIEPLGDVVVAFPMAAQEEHFVVDAVIAVVIQFRDLVLEALPLRLLVIRIKVCICVVLSVY